MLRSPSTRLFARAKSSGSKSRDITLQRSIDGRSGDLDTPELSSAKRSFAQIRRVEPSCLKGNPMLSKNWVIRKLLR
jgi:hypothetical protein